MTRAALYVRVSTDEQAQSAEEQERGALAWCQRNGHDVVAVLRDVGVSGAEWKHRPGVLELERQAKLTPRPFDLVVVRDADRLGRDAIRLPLILATLNDHGVKVVAWSTGEALDASDGMSTLIIAVRAGVAQMQREQIAHVTRTALKTRAERGMVAGGRVYGYTNERGADGARYVVNDREAEVVREIFQRRAAGESTRTIARSLNARGIPSPNAQCGCTWGPSEVRVVARSTRYRGEAQYGRRGTKYVGGSRVAIVRGDEHVVTYAVPPIVDDALWHAARANTVEARATVGGYVHRGPVAKYLLIGHAVCGVCGARIGSASSSSATSAGRVTIPGYACGAARDRGTCGARWRRPVDRLDGPLLDWLVGSVLSPDVVGAALAKSRAAVADAPLDAPDPRAMDARGRVEDLERRVARLVRALEHDDSPDVFASLRQRRGELAATRCELDALTPTAAVVPAGDAAALLARLADLRPVVEAARRENPSLLRAVLGAVLTGPVRITEGERKGPLTVEAEAAPGALLSVTLPGVEGMQGVQVPAGGSPARRGVPLAQNRSSLRGGYDHITVGPSPFGPVLRFNAVA